MLQASRNFSGNTTGNPTPHTTDVITHRICQELQTYVTLSHTKHNTAQLFCMKGLALWLGKRKTRCQTQAHSIKTTLNESICQQYWTTTTVYLVHEMQADTYFTTHPTVSVSKSDSDRAHSSWGDCFMMEKTVTTVDENCFGDLGLFGSTGVQILTHLHKVKQLQHFNIY